jgi:LytS/YehU family sensor histidine kinase
MSRLGERLKVGFTVLGEDASANKYIPPMLFLSLVENGFKHGASNVPGETEINIKIDLSRDFATLYVDNSLNVHDDRSQMRNMGVGLQNINRQLDLIYGSRHQFIQEVRNNRFISSLKIPYTNGKR